MGRMLIVYPPDIPNPWELSCMNVVKSNSNDSPASMDFVSKWLDDCLGHHTPCKYESDPFLPTRVLDVGVSSSSHIKLMDSEGGKGRYLCLSYCWGKSEFIKTTKSNLHDHIRGISWDKLPRVFQDTVRIARALNVRYVWIDALCIIQKDKEDWDAESKCMANIYRQALLTVGAASAADPDQDVFSAARRTLRVGPIISLVTPHFPRHRDNFETRFPMLTRAWTYQERLLAPRVLYLGSQEVLWECYEHHTCECGDAGYYSSRPSNRMMKKTYYNTCLQPGLSSWLLHSAWREIVMTYSTLKLSYTEDILPAISALADIIYDQGGSEYLGGLWRESLLFDMCWEVDSRDISTISNGLPWRAPSWSWASVDKPVRYRIGFTSGEGCQPYREQAKIHETVCTANSPSPTGRVTRPCHIVLDCQLIPAQRDAHGLKVGDFNMKAVSYDGKHDIVTLEAIYLVPLMSTCVRQSTYWNHYGIVITPSLGSLDEFERVGLATGFSKDPEFFDKQSSERQLVKIV
jgi:hypothetical protein